VKGSWSITELALVGASREPPLNSPLVARVTQRILGGEPIDEECSAAPDHAEQARRPGRLSERRP
jgi:hypothetical protein